MTRDHASALLGARHIIAGVNLLPLPGSPRYDRSGGMRAILTRARNDVDILEGEGVDSLIFANEADAPWPRRLAAETLAAFTAVVGEVMTDRDIPFGVHPLVDPVTGVASAHATGAGFIRGTFAGAYITDVGFVDSNPADASRLRSTLGADSILFLHNLNPSMGGSLLGKTSLAEVRGALAHCEVDGFTVRATSAAQPTPGELLGELRCHMPNVPLIVGRGATGANIGQLLPIADGVIVVSCLRRDGHYLGEIDVERVREFMLLVRRARSGDLSGQDVTAAGGRT